MMNPKSFAILLTAAVLSIPPVFGQDEDRQTRRRNDNRAADAEESRPSWRRGDNRAAAAEEETTYSRRSSREEKNPTVQKLRRDFESLDKLVPEARAAFPGTPLRRQCNQAMTTFQQQTKTMQKAIDEMRLGVNFLRHARFYNDVYNGAVDSGEDDKDDKDKDGGSRSSSRSSSRRDRERDRNRRESRRGSMFRGAIMAMRDSADEAEDGRARRGDSRSAREDARGDRRGSGRARKKETLYAGRAQKLKLPQTNYQLSVQWIKEDIDALEDLGFRWNGKRYEIDEDKRDKVDYLEFQRLFRYYAGYASSFRECVQNAHWKRDFEQRLKRMIALAPQLQAKLNRLDPKTGGRHDLPTAVRGLNRVYRWYSLNPDEEKMELQTKVGLDGGEQAIENLSNNAMKAIDAFLQECADVLEVKKEELAAEAAKLKEQEREAQAVIDAWMSKAGLAPTLPTRVTQEQIRAFRNALTPARRSRFDALMKQQLDKGYSQESAGRRAIRSLQNEIESGALEATPQELQTVAERLKKLETESPDAEGTDDASEETASPSEPESETAAADESAAADDGATTEESASDSSSDADASSPAAGETDETTEEPPSATSAKPQFEDWD